MEKVITAHLANYKAGLIDAYIRSGEKSGYGFEYEIRYSSGIYPPYFRIRAFPLKYKKSGKRSFQVDSSCNIHAIDKGGLSIDLNDPVTSNCPGLIQQAYEVKIKDALQDIFDAQMTYRKTVGKSIYAETLTALWETENLHIIFLK